MTGTEAGAAWADVIPMVIKEEKPAKSALRREIVFIFEPP